MKHRRSTRTKLFFFSFKIGTQVESNFPNLRFPSYFSIFAFPLLILAFFAFPLFILAFFAFPLFFSLFQNSSISFPNVGCDHMCTRKEPSIFSSNEDARDDQCLGYRNDGQSIILTLHDNQSNAMLIENPFPFESFPM